MMIVSLSPVVAVLLACFANAQTIPTDLVGTWSSGAGNVVTGSGFANPSNTSFTYPKTTGISYSFTSDGWYEIARYRFVSNGSEPNCITASMNWVHGTFTQVSNGSLILTPNGDGYQQIQDPCAATSNFIENYNKTELVKAYQVFTDSTKGLTLQIYTFDGSPLAPQYQVFSTPNMLPTQQMRNVTTVENATRRRKRSNGAEKLGLGLGLSGSGLGWKEVVTAAGAVAAVVVSTL